MAQNSLTNVLTVNQGKHSFKPYRFGLRWKPYAMIYGVQFDKNAKYDLEGVDQKDWNKGGGISYSLFSNHKNSIMWAWRYDTFAEMFEFSGYTHNRGQVQKSEPAIFKVAPGESVSIFIRIESDLTFFEFRSSNQAKVFSMETPKRRSLARVIGAWFGGNQAAPKKLSFLQYQKQIQ